MADSDLSILEPIVIDDAALTSTTAPENDYSAYNPATTYAVGDKVIVISTHSIYESQLAGNTGNDPTDIENRTGPTIWWLKVGATNAWKMFDEETSSQTVIASPLTVVIKPDVFFSALTLFGVRADTVTVIEKDAPGGNIVFNKTYDMENSRPGDWYEYFFSAFDPQTDLVVDDLIPRITGEITITFTSSGNVACGALNLGILNRLGSTAQTPVSIPKTFSHIEIDKWGNNKIVHRNSAKDITNIRALVDLSDANEVVRLLTCVLDKPVPVIVSPRPEYSGVRTIGLVTGALEYDKPKHCTLKMNVRGLI